MSSATVARCGTTSDITWPESPRGANLWGAPQKLGVDLQKRELLAPDVRIGADLAVQFVELRLIVKHVDRRRGARHMQVNDVLGPRLKVRRLGTERIGRLMSLAGAANSFSFKSDASAIVPRPATESLKICRRVLILRISSPVLIVQLPVTFGTCVGSYSAPDRAARVQPLVRVSSRFRSTFATTVQAASSAYLDSPARAGTRRSRSTPRRGHCFGRGRVAPGIVPGFRDRVQPDGPARRKRACERAPAGSHNGHDPRPFPSNRSQCGRRARPRAERRRDH